MNDNMNPKSRKRKMPIAVIIGSFVTLILLIVCLVLFAWYKKSAMIYEQVYFPNTFINGIDASGKTVEEVKDLIVTGAEGYKLTIHGRDGYLEEITRDDIQLQSVFDGSLEQILEDQSPMEWYQKKKEVKNFEIETMLAYDEEQLEEKISNLGCFDESKVIKPENAYLSEYVPGQGYHIVEEILGNETDYEVVREKIIEAVQGLKTEVSLEEMNSYVKPEVTKDDPQLLTLMNTLNRYIGVKITYEFGDKQEILDGDKIVEWLSVQADGSVGLSREGVSSFVKSLALKYNTAYQPKTLQTSYGKSVRITAGNYGWRINHSAEVDDLVELIRSGESQKRTPNYFQKAASHGDQDFGNTYVEINLTAQHLFFYKDGKLVIESDFVSGNQSKGYDTPVGAFPITYKERNATLKGENYATPVSYWIPFNGNVGMHDASWRSSFGETIYKTNGSHGCINLPPNVAKTIYEQIEAGMPVLVYQLEGTENSGKQEATSTEPTESESVNESESIQETEEMQPSETQPAETQPVETQPAETQPETTTPEESDESEPESSSQAMGPGL